MTKEELYYLPASELLKYIQAEKERLIKEKIIKKSKSLLPITEENQAFNLPKDWIWCKLNDISFVTKLAGFEYTKNIAPNLVLEGVPLFKGKNIQNGEIIYQFEGFIPKEISESLPRSRVTKKCLLTPYVGTIGNIALHKKEGNYHLGSNVGKIEFFNEKKRLISEEYILYYLRSSYGFEQLTKHKKSTAQESISIEAIRDVDIPLPPLYVQDQIVQKLEQLSETKDSLLSHAESQLNYTKKMREALLQEAIRGELVPQDENDEPASVLLEKIKTEKERLIKEKVIKKQKELPPITDEENPYELPKGWEWVRLGEISQTLNYGYTASATDIDTGVKMLRITDVQDNKVNWETVPFCEIDPEKLSSYILHPNDIVIARTGGTVGKSFIIKDISCTSVFASYLIRVQLLENINATYVKKFIESPLYWDQLVDKTTGTGQPNVNATSLSQLILPLPPLAEQKRIVAKLDELIAHCEQLEFKAEEMKKYTTKLFEASLKEAFMPE